jgi:hypothetical protein
MQKTFLLILLMGLLVMAGFSQTTRELEDAQKRFGRSMVKQGSWSNMWTRYRTFDVSFDGCKLSYRTTVNANLNRREAPNFETESSINASLPATGYMSRTISYNVELSTIEWDMVEVEAGLERGTSIIRIPRDALDVEISAVNNNRRFEYDVMPKPIDYVLVVRSKGVDEFVSGLNRLVRLCRNDEN